jgi:hypothetical protein
VRVPRELVAANAAALLVLLVAMLLGWHEAATFGLATLVILNLLVLLRGRPTRGGTVPEESEERHGETEGEGRDG